MQHLWAVLAVWLALLIGYMLGAARANGRWYARIDRMRDRQFTLDQQPGYTYALDELMRARGEGAEDPW